MNDLAFDPATHEYRLDGRRVPSVSQILQSAGLIQPYTGDPFYGERGTAIHDACQKFNAEGDVWNFDPVVVPFVDAWKRFRADVMFGQIIMAEERVYQSAYLFAGTPDLVVKIGNDTVLMDIKSGGRQPWHSIQLAGYAVLVRGRCGSVKRWAVYLAEDGSYKVEAFTDRRDEGIFLAALSIVQWKEKNNG